MEKPSELQIGKIVPQLTFEELKPVLIHLGLSYSEITTIERDCQGNTHNAMFLCLQLWRQKMLDATLADINNGRKLYPHIVHGKHTSISSSSLTSEIFVYEREKTNQEWTIQIHWQHWGN